MKKFFSSPLGVALIGAIMIVLQQALTNNQTDWKAIGWAALISVIGVIGNFWKGKGLTITGIIGTVAYTLYTLIDGNDFTWTKFGITAAIAILALIVPAPGGDVEQEG